MVAVCVKVPARNMREFIEFAKTNTTSMGTYAPGSYPHRVADHANRVEGTKILSVHNRGESPMWTDVASGQTQIAIGSYQAFATVQGRGVRSIGVTGVYRSPKLPDVPTLVEGANSERAAKLRETFAIPNKPKYPRKRAGTGSATCRCGSSWRWIWA